MSLTGFLKQLVFADIRIQKGNHSMKQSYEYTITLTSQQATEIQNALEAIMRWKLRQPNIMQEYLPERLPWKENFDEALEKRDLIREKLKEANDIAIPHLENLHTLKDDQWHRIYNIFAVIRHAIQQAEHPDSKGVDSYPVIDSGGVGLPEIKWEKK